MRNAQKKKTATAVAQENIVGGQRSQSSVEDAVRMVRISFLVVVAKIDMVE
jgi:hypothetical protein